MKMSKVHKRLAKIEALISDLTERYSQGAVHVRAALQGAKVAVAHLRAAVTSHASSGAASAETPKPAKRKLSTAHRRAIQEGVQRRLAEKKAVAAKESGVAKKSSPASKKAAVKKATGETPTGHTAKKTVPLKKSGPLTPQSE